MCFISAADSVLEFEAYCAAVAHCRNAPDQSVSMIVKMSKNAAKTQGRDNFLQFLFDVVELHHIHIILEII